MRELFRDLAIQVVLITCGIALTIGVILGWIAFEFAEQRWEAGDGLPSGWVTVLTVLLFILLSLAISYPVARSVGARASEAAVEPLRRLAQRTDEMASGGFALDPQARPGRVVDPEPWRAGLLEVDAIAREIDRHHSTFSRALVHERSFAADASHQLRTPMAALLLRLEEIAQAEDVEVARAEAEIAIGQVERLTGVVDELLRRTRAGHASGGALSAVDVVLAGLDEEWTPAFAGVDRHIELTTERGIIVEASASSLSQILNTLVENALIHGEGRVDVHVARSGPSAVFAVTDQGRGIPSDLARQIFDRAVTTGTGTGLGLAVARETAEDIGGRLELTQLRPPVFVLYLPLAETP